MSSTSNAPDNVEPLRGGGSLILGQDQDDVNAGRLDRNQAYKLVSYMQKRFFLMVIKIIFSGHFSIKRFRKILRLQYLH